MRRSASVGSVPIWEESGGRFLSFQASRALHQICNSQAVLPRVQLVGKDWFNSCWGTYFPFTFFLSLFTFFFFLWLPFFYLCQGKAFALQNTNRRNFTVNFSLPKTFFVLQEGSNIQQTGSAVILHMILTSNKELEETFHKFNKTIEALVGPSNSMEAKQLGIALLIFLLLC